MKKAIKMILAEIDYFLHRTIIKKGNIEVYSIDETIDELIHSEKSIVRFGDGEITMMRGMDLTFQKGSPEIATGLKRIIRYEYDKLMVAIPDIFNDLSIYRKESRYFWKEHLLFSRKVYLQVCSKKNYYNAYISRFYYPMDNKSHCEAWIEKIKSIWSDKDVVVVEGEKTHNGVGNDLLDSAKTIERIICPSREAYQVLEEIINECKRFPKDRLFLVSLGVAAKFVAEALFLEGYRVLDIGNLDMEYEWYLCGASEKEPIPKHDVIGIEANQKAGYQTYLNQIVKRIEL